jgi:hypothetical protein
MFCMTFAPDTDALPDRLRKLSVEDVKEDRP